MLLFNYLSIAWSEWRPTNESRLREIAIKYSAIIAYTESSPVDMPTAGDRGDNFCLFVQIENTNYSFNRMQNA